MCLFQLSFPWAAQQSHSLIYLMINCWWTKTHMKMMPATHSLTVTDTLSFSLSRICFQTDGWFVSFVMFLCMFAFIHSWKCRHTCKHPLYFDCSAASAAAATTSHFSMTIWMKESRQSKKTTTTNSYNSLEVAHKLSECCLCHCHRWWWWLV